jgi:dethiobiotin synthetase
VSPRFIIAGTDTGIGKTVFAAALTAALDGVYFKPVQAGLAGETDAQAVARLSGLPGERILAEIYRLTLPASPHVAADADHVAIDPDRLTLPETGRALIVEPAGGLMVPLTWRTLSIDLIKRWNAPVILCARTALGTINHSLLSIEALRARDIPVLGIAFIGDEVESTERSIAEFGKVRRLGRLPFLDPLNRDMLAAAFAENFNLADFTGAEA